MEMDDNNLYVKSLRKADSDHLLDLTSNFGRASFMTKLERILMPLVSNVRTDAAKYILEKDRGICSWNPKSQFEIVYGALEKDPRSPYQLFKEIMGALVYHIAGASEKTSIKYSLMGGK